MLRDLEHPEVTWALETGYTSYNQPREIRCERCGDIIEDEIFEDEDYEILCKDCLLDLHLNLSKNW